MWVILDVKASLYLQIYTKDLDLGKYKLNYLFWEIPIIISDSDIWYTNCCVPLSLFLSIYPTHYEGVF